jgi:Tfp pilus assembly protein PilF
MSYRKLSILAALFVSSAFIPTMLAGPADDAFDQGQQALAAKDYPTAIAKLQQAVQLDPDSLRNASQLRQAVLRQTIGAHPKEGSPADFDAEIAFFQKAAADHPMSSNILLNYGFAYVDKIPAALLAQGLRARLSGRG